jgi:hypothetical protein
VRNEMVEQNKKLQLDVHNLVKVSTPRRCRYFDTVRSTRANLQRNFRLFFVFSVFLLSVFFFSVCSFCVGFKKPVPKSH